MNYYCEECAGPGCWVFPGAISHIPWRSIMRNPHISSRIEQEPGLTTADLEAVYTAVSVEAGGFAPDSAVAFGIRIFLAPGIAIPRRTALGYVAEFIDLARLSSGERLMDGYDAAPFSESLSALIAAPAFLDNDCNEEWAQLAPFCLTRPERPFTQFDTELCIAGARRGVPLMVLSQALRRSGSFYHEDLHANMGLLAQFNALSPSEIRAAGLLSASWTGTPLELLAAAREVSFV